ncbi:sarcosine oxidase subunit beta [Dongia mobilis]|uniref:Sarcosine oxidase subunit beta n=1 Tax=Dongia mobilis TaxID=578943 RepID=A0A4R6WRB1_9PROT|nr:FAD-binding oxidoreductase [Dongia mobilis]TDQ84125.1 sarcosine oxidase subunit beta [Dongia mobilis]
MQSNHSIVIIGGGIQGLSIAFNLARLGVRDVRVLDAGYFQGGASGRNGTLIRGGFGSPEWTGFFAHSNRLWAELSATLGENVMFTPRGYLVIAQKAETLARLDGMRDLHREHGLQSDLLAVRRIKELEPAIDEHAVLGAIYLKGGGAAPHHAAMKGYLAASRRLGARIDYQRPVTAVERSGDRITTVIAGDERIACEKVVIAGGAYSPAIGKLVGAEIPGFPIRIEAMALEPVRPVIRSAIALPDRLCYMHQTARGEIVGGAEVPEKPQVTLNTDICALAATAAAYAEVFPALGALRILRHWAGMLHATADWGPLLGQHPDVGNLWVSAGWSYGFAGAPAAGDLLARAIVTGEVDSRMAPFAVDRFRRNQPVVEGAIVLAPVD